MTVGTEGVVLPVVQVPIDPTIKEAALHVGEASVVVEAAFIVATTTVPPAPVPMIKVKVNIKSKSAHTIATIRAPKTISIKMEVVVMQGQLPLLSILPRARQMATLRATAISKVRLKLRLNIQCEYRQLSYVVASVEPRLRRGKPAAPHCFLLAAQQTLRAFVASFELLISESGEVGHLNEASGNEFAKLLSSIHFVMTWAMR